MYATAATTAARAPIPLNFDLSEYDYNLPGEQRVPPIPYSYRGFLSSVPIETILAIRDMAMSEGRESIMQSFIQQGSKVQSARAGGYLDGFSDGRRSSLIEDRTKAEAARTARSVNTGVQTDQPPRAPSPPAPPVRNSVAIQASPAMPLSRSWADEVDHSVSSHQSPSPPLVPVSQPRDLSALRPSTNSRPFSTLQRRTRRVHGSPRQNGSPRHPRRSYRSPPGHASFQPSVQYVAVDIPWESDPRLIELGRVLTSLGWARVAPVRDEDVAHIFRGSGLPYVT